jgi:hypothetical protein
MAVSGHPGQKKIYKTPYQWGKAAHGGVHLSSQQQWEAWIMVQAWLGKKGNTVSKIKREKRDKGLSTTGSVQIV